MPPQAKILISMLVACCLSGCWDRVELEERGFIIGAAIDAADAPEGGNGGQQADEKRFNVTFQYVVPSAMVGGGSGASPHSGKAYFNISGSGSSIEMIVRNIASRTSRSPYFEHIKVILIAKQVAIRPSGLVSALDFFLRGNDMRRSIRILIVDGKASDALAYAPPNDKLPVSYIESISNNKRESANMLSPIRLGDLQEFMLRKCSYAIQRLSLNKNGISVSGASLFDGSNNQLLGFLNQKETLALNMLRGNVQEGAIEMTFDGGKLSFVITEVEHKMKVDVSNPEQPAIRIAIQIFGRVSEMHSDANLIDEQVFDALHKEVEQHIHGLLASTMAMMQQKYKKDYLDAGRQIGRKHPRVWKRIEPNWEQGQQLFARSEVTLAVTVRINTSGIINHSADQAG